MIQDYLKWLVTLPEPRIAYTLFLGRQLGHLKYNSICLSLFKLKDHIFRK